MAASHSPAEGKMPASPDEHAASSLAGEVAGLDDV
jgi:hypothetical protein